MFVLMQAVFLLRIDDQLLEVDLSDVKRRHFVLCYGFVVGDCDRVVIDSEDVGKRFWLHATNAVWCECC